MPREDLTLSNNLGEWRYKRPSPSVRPRASRIVYPGCLSRQCGFWAMTTMEFVMTIEPLGPWGSAPQ
ncbi:hypothetical protein E2562_039445 [Oryza meyeriana var. granulata]|uniref:Uncharacterized protein n=1 Tax=Oryza meyeriana var. granulata TaxID=110450 RepID=A0A6G1EDC6_9ORYZ|nr:hypothetical protein E2562_039445 [Oryza meyeriana var. granulata]